MTIVMGVFEVVGIIIVILAFYLLFVAFVPVLRQPKQRLEKARQGLKESDAKVAQARKEVRFSVKGALLSAWLYMPEDLSAPVPCIIMGNGTGGTKEVAGLERYALRYRQAGFAVLIFDYRYFGESGGKPRQLIWIPSQLEDYAAAIEYARSLGEIDPAKIALWGTSLSGGHVIVAAARDNRIACVIAQCPGLDGRASAMMALKKHGIGYMLRMMVHGQRDIFRSWLGLSPHKIPIVGKPGSIALITTADGWDFFEKFVPENYVNEACARIILRGDKYRPVKHARNVRCPALLQICDRDSIIPISAATEAEKQLGRYAEVKHYSIGHFDIYTGDNFEKSVSDQVDFLKKHL